MLCWNFQPRAFESGIFLHRKVLKCRIVWSNTTTRYYYGFRNDKIYADEQLAQFSPGDDL
jgi:hypothetical protein